MCGVKYDGAARKFDWQVLDAYRGVEKLMTIETIYIRKLKSNLNLNTRNKMNKSDIYNKIRPTNSATALVNSRQKYK